MSPAIQAEHSALQNMTNFLLFFLLHIVVLWARLAFLSSDPDSLAHLVPVPTLKKFLVPIPIPAPSPFPAPVMVQCSGSRLFSTVFQQYKI